MTDLKLSAISGRLSSDSGDAWSRIFPSTLEKLLLRLVVASCALLVGCVFAEQWRYRNEVGVVAGVVLVFASLVLMLLSVFRDIATVAKELRSPLSGVDDAYQRFFWAVHTLRDYPVEQLVSMRNFVLHRDREIRRRIGFFAGSLEVVGIVPVLIGGWWAWRSASSPTQFSFPEQLLIASAFGIYTGALLARSKLATLARVEHVLAEAIRIYGPEDGERVRTRGDRTRIRGDGGN